MIIETLQVRNVRNLSSIELSAHPRLNYLFGDNGAGKTSLLEAIAVLSRGRSFRTNQATELAGPESKVFSVFARTRESGGSEHRLGLERSGTHWRGRLDGQDVAQLSQLTRRLPLVVMEPDSHLLVSGPPETRRRFLDWGMFHVEQGFLEIARQFNKSLKQRNAALRNGRVDVLESIDEVFADKGETLSGMRKRHCERISDSIGDIMSDLTDRVAPIKLTYQNGWNGDSLREALVVRRERDMERGASGAGPHRAELEILCDKRPAKAIFSRGEQKVLSAAMLLTQASLLAANGEHPVLLLDDLVSEFDRDHFEKVLKTALDAGGQVWVTGTSERSEFENAKVFHVKQGTCRELV